MSDHDGVEPVITMAWRAHCGRRLVETCALRDSRRELKAILIEMATWCRGYPGGRYSEPAEIEFEPDVIQKLGIGRSWRTARSARRRMPKGVTPNVRQPLENGGAMDNRGVAAGLADQCPRRERLLPVRLGGG
jgi:hypothetical protein